VIEVIGDLLAGLLLDGAQAEDSRDDGGFTEGKTEDGLFAEDNSGRIAIALLAIAIGHHAAPANPPIMQGRIAENTTDHR